LYQCVKNVHFTIPRPGQLKRSPHVNAMGPHGLDCETEHAMTRQLQQPSKESVRAWLRARIAARRPPPDAQQIRRELGWELVTPPPRQRR
jgi:glycosyltransferase A (GT-A) superfamily protein (DUF2064 family)